MILGDSEGEELKANRANRGAHYKYNRRNEDIPFFLPRKLPARPACFDGTRNSQTGRQTPARPRAVPPSERKPCPRRPPFHCSQVQHGCPRRWSVCLGRRSQRGADATRPNGSAREEAAADSVTSGHQRRRQCRSPLATFVWTRGGCDRREGTRDNTFHFKLQMYSFLGENVSFT